MHRISSDTSAAFGKAGVVLVILGVLLAGVGIIVLLSYDDSEKTYEVSVNITAMDVACDGGYVYDVAANTSAGIRYYNRVTNQYETSPSDRAIMYTQIKMENVTKYTDQTDRPVSAGEPVRTGDAGVQPVTFKVTTSENRIEIVLFLMIAGTSSDPADGTIADIYEPVPGESGIRLTINLENGSTSGTIKGNSQSQIRGLLEYSIAVSAA